MVRTSVNTEPADIKVIVFRQFTSFEGFIASRDTAIHINMVAMEIAISDIFHAPFIEKSLESAIFFMCTVRRLYEIMFANISKAVCSTPL